MLLTKLLEFAQQNAIPLTLWRTDKALAVLKFCKGTQHIAGKGKIKKNIKKKTKAENLAEFKVRI